MLCNVFIGKAGYCKKKEAPRDTVTCEATRIKNGNANPNSLQSGKNKKHDIANAKL